MQAALRGKSLDRAQKHHQSAVKILEDNRDQLAAHPEIDLFEKRVEKAGAVLCYEFVNIPLAAFFDDVRGKDIGAARSRLKAARKEFERCQDRILGLDDFVALKMNLDSAPQVLVGLEGELGKVALAEKMHAFKRDLDEQILSIQRKIGKLEKQANQKELALDVFRQIRAVKQNMENRNEFTELPEWATITADAKASLRKLDVRRASLVRRGKVLWLVKNLMPDATKKAFQAVAVRKNSSALKAFQKALRGFKECDDMVGGLLEQEPGLARFSFQMEGRKKTVAWLKDHCMTSRVISDWLSEVLRMVENTVPKASRLASRAMAAHDQADALTLFSEAFTGYYRCHEMLTDILKKEPRMAWFTFRWEGDEKTVDWMKKHCGISRKIAERRVYKISGRKPKPPKKPEAAAIKIESKTEAPKKKSRRKTKKKKRRRRIRRW
jgi:hypothetical protein